MTDYYTLFGLTKYSSKDDIKKQYRLLLEKHHPDLGGDGDPEKLNLVIEAYKHLMFDADNYILNLHITVTLSHEQLASMLGTTHDFMSSDIDAIFSVKVPYETRIGDTILIKNIAHSTNLKITFKDENE
jgi:DnaJ-class molecular chaperone